MQSDFHGWLPHQLCKETQDVRWQYVGNTAFTEPFFDETLASCLSLPENSFGSPRITSLKELTRIAHDVDAIEPSAFIFHTSRCGSTLVSQLFGLDEACIALSEVRLFDELLRARFRPRLAGRVDVATHLPAAIRLYGQRRLGTERSLVIKLDSWHLAFYPELRALYPHSPFILLYREPSAIFRSHQRRPGMHAVPGLIENAVFRFPPEDQRLATRSSHLSHVLAFYYETLLTAARTDSRSLLVEYQPDMVPVVESIAEFADIELATPHREKMRARATFHSKAPQAHFRGDPSSKIEELPMRCCLDSYQALAQWGNQNQASMETLIRFSEA